MICKVADKREAPPGDTSKQQKPKPAECERILGIYSNINICLFLRPTRVIGIPIVWLWNWWKLCWLKFSLRCCRAYILDTLPLSFAHRIPQMFIHEIRRVESFLCSNKIVSKFCFANPFFFVNGSVPKPFPKHSPCDGASVLRYAALYCIMHLSEHTLRMYCVNLCLFEIYIFALKRNLCEVSSKRRH